MKKIFTALAILLLFVSCVGDTDKAPIESLDRKISNLPVADKFKNEDFAFNDYASDSIAFQTNDQKQGERKKPDVTANPDWDKKVVKTASLEFQVKDYKIFNTSFREKIKQSGGYVSQEEQKQSDYRIENNVVIKVPVDQFDNLISQLLPGADKIIEKRITSQDVTMEFVDTKSRLEAKKQVRQRYLDLLKQAKNMEEILNVQNEINEIQEQIESANGRINYLSHSSALSTIDLQFYQILNASAKDTDKPSFGTKLSEAFKTGWSWVGDLFIGIVSIWPLFLMIFAAFIIYKRWRTPKTKQVEQQASLSLKND